MQYHLAISANDIASISKYSKEEEMEVRHNPEDEKLQSLFSNQFKYDIDEIVKVNIGDKPSDMGLLAIDRILNSISIFTNALEEKKVDTVTFKHDLEYLKYALSLLS